tara:strand:- start:433 stop:621 length:189 start_codon:yes stop_codon:yes gene_type:complete
MLTGGKYLYFIKRNTGKENKLRLVASVVAEWIVNVLKKLIAVVIVGRKKDNAPSNEMCCYLS